MGRSMRTKLISALLLASLTASQARIWTSADGSRTFEGEIKSYNSSTQQVTVQSNGRDLTFTDDKLSSDDLQFIKNWHKGEMDKAARKKAFASQTIGPKLTNRVLVRLDGKRFKKTELGKEPEFYLLYYSASW